jgi:hypothetical protein
MPAESAARVAPKNLRRLMLPGAIGSFVIFPPEQRSHPAIIVAHVMICKSLKMIVIVDIYHI